MDSVCKGKKSMALESTIIEVKPHFAVQQFTRSGKETELHPKGVILHQILQQELALLVIKF